ncbi:PREDICTED: E3 ubiquitin-protein ligase RAD18-like [Wasmannia auropunctata]|uniref:E3 ubiquitin-protein ligase RAD18-like n=1 Tax=Wasmannia auropunctata TaxID=64793 RepID=UPI0005EFCE63|nr:PREDICTED: E3 ubiquitin-protein ligase RAD18-like [Wasmannia auropunctata]
MWSTEYVELKRIDELLQCGICYEYMDTCVITSCSHSYCSLCIRKYLHYKTQCPICSEETFEKDLRKNKLLDEIIMHYLNFKEKHDKKFHREKLTAKNDNSGMICSTNNFACKKEQDVSDVTAEVSHKSSDSPTLAAGNTTPRRRKDHQQDVSTPSTSTDLRIPSMFTPKSRKGLQKEEDRRVVTCPVCKVEVSENNINRHLDDCLKRANTKDCPKKSEPKRKPLPKLVLSLMKDNVIRKRLKELGLSSQGDRKVLENRLQRYTVLFNAECDKTYPRPVSELIKQCEEEENLEKKVQKPLNRLNVNRNTEHNVIEQQRKKYLTTNKDSFDQLIARVKHDSDPQKMCVRRNILNEKNFDAPLNDRVADNDSTIKDCQRNNFALLNSSANCIEDSDSSSSPLQSYFSENPMNFLSVELASSNDSIDQCASNHYTSNCQNETSSDSFDPIINSKNIKIKEPSFENVLIHEEITSINRSKQCDFLDNEMDMAIKESVSELDNMETEDGVQTRLKNLKRSRSDTKYSSDNEMDMDIKESVSELDNMETENGEQARLENLKRSRSDTKYSSGRHVAYSEPRDRWQKELCNDNVDSIVEDVDFVEDSIDIQDDCERPKHEQSNKTMTEYAAGSIKSEKENMKIKDKILDKDIATWTLRKREREMAFALSDEEKIVERGTIARKSLRLGLSEAKGFNNENFGETMRDEEKSQSEKEQSQVICLNNIRNVARKSVRLRNKKSK